MFVNRLKLRFRIWLLQRRHLKDGQWKLSTELVKELVDLIDPTLLTAYTPRMGKTIHLKVVHRNVIDLFNLLGEATELVVSLGSVTRAIQKSRSQPGSLTLIRLDDYLTTPSNVPIKPSELHHGIAKQVTDLNLALTNLGSTQGGNRDYYCRQYTHLLEETLVFLLALVEVCFYAERKPVKDLKLSR